MSNYYCEVDAQLLAKDRDHHLHRRQLGEPCRFLTSIAPPSASMPHQESIHCEKSALATGV